MSHSKTLLLLACAVALFAAPAMAGPLAGDTTTVGGIWHGSTTFIGPNAITGPLKGNVDWAVWAPNTFPAGFTGYTPTLNEYVYAYQMNVDPTGVAMSELKVGLQTQADNQGSFTGTNDGFGFGTVSGDAPNGASFLISADQSTWDFDGILPGGMSKGLAFSSLYAPKLGDGTVTNNGDSTFVIPLPTPTPPNIPEPGTLTLAACGLVMFALQLLWRRGRKTGL
jgi:hypothetical protein